MATTSLVGIRSPLPAYNPAANPAALFPARIPVQFTKTPLPRFAMSSVNFQYPSTFAGHVKPVLPLPGGGTGGGGGAVGFPIDSG